MPYTAGRMTAPDDLPYRVLALLVPVLVLLVHLVVLYATLPYSQYLAIIALMAAYVLPPAGKETVIPIGIALGIPWWYMALSIAMIDVETGLFMGLNFSLAYRIPVIGRILSGVTEKMSHYLEARRWLAGLYFFGIVLMVMVPVFGSGGIRGSIAGKLLGMDNYLLFCAIVIGAFTGCFLIALGSATLIGFICSSGIVGPSGTIPFVCNGTV